jgi:hypothetical protein
MNIAHPKTNIRRTFAKLCFDFMAGTVTMEPGFYQQVASEAFKNIPNADFLAGWEGRKNRYVKCEAINARTLVRTQATHLCLNSQFNLTGLIIPIGINIYDIPGRKSSRRDVTDLRLHD